MKKEAAKIVCTQITSVPAVGKNETKRNRILALDYGHKRIGLALSDEFGLTAQPLATLTRTNRQADIRRLREICREHGVARIVVGHPVHMTGERGVMADEAGRFARRLKKQLGVEVELMDERLTTWEATEIARRSSSKRKPGAHVDDLAAAVLLREYLESQSNRVRDAADKG
jgi:putative holliday junction resolvase